MAKAGSGDIRVQDIEEHVEIDTGSGGSAVARVRASVSADTGSGDLELGEIGGEISVRVGSGDTQLRRLGGSMHVAAGSGDISLQSSVPDGVEWVLEAGSGDVALLLPSDSRFNLNARSITGEIETAFGLRSSEGIEKPVEGKVGENPTSSITIKTAHGDIKIAAKQEATVAR